MNPDISLILPAYNEARVIPVTICEAVRYFDSRKLRYEIIVAADGADGTVAGWSDDADESHESDEPGLSERSAAVDDNGARSDPAPVARQPTAGP